jgi:hypothetical protein
MNAKESKADRLKVAEDALIDLATVTHSRTVSGIHEKGDKPKDYRTTVTDVVSSDYRKLIERIVRNRGDSDEANASRAEIAEKSKDPKLAEHHMRKAMHFPGADAVEGANYNPQVRAAGLEEADRKRRAVLVVIGQDKAEAKTGKRPDPSEIKVEEVAKELKANVEINFGKDKLAREMLVGIIEKPGGNPLATIEFAIKHESKELIIAQFKRMDRAEVEQLVKDYAKAHPGEKGLDQILGINGYHWNGHNWNGAIFSGDAQQIEIAGWLFRKIPRRAEVALRVMDQQIDQSTWLVQLAGAEYESPQEREQLRTMMGVTAADID